MNIRLVAGEVLLEANRIMFVKMHLDVEVCDSAFTGSYLFDRNCRIKLRAGEDSRKAE